MILGIETHDWGNDKFVARKLRSSARDAKLIAPDAATERLECSMRLKFCHKKPLGAQTDEDIVGSTCAVPVLDIGPVESDHIWAVSLGCRP